MRMYDLIQKKKLGEPLREGEISYLVEGFTAGEIPDYQMAAFLMAVCLRGMTLEETAALTMAMAHSGEMVDLSPLPGVKVDKHSTGGVGDKTTLIVAPMVAACGGVVAKMSGRGLGHTGGTVDKLESIPGTRTSLSREEFFQVVRTAGLAVVGQSGNLAPADKKIYALRDVTATVDSIPLIASSILSKKIAAGADAILLDVKTGSGAFMKTLDGSLELSREMVQIGEQVGRRTVALVTQMDIPLGQAVGNALEVMEAVETLRGKGPRDLTQVCVRLAAEMLALAGKGTVEECAAMAGASLADGTALERFQGMVKAQGGDPSALEDWSLLPKAAVCRELVARQDGYLCHMDTEKVGIASVVLGAGRETKDSPIDPGAGIWLLKKTGDRVRAGEPIARLYGGDDRRLDEGEALYREALQIGTEPPVLPPLVMARVSRKGIERF